MQISAIATPPHGPIAIGQYGDIKIGYALNGVAYKSYPIFAPVAAPVATYNGSVQDAIAGAQKFIANEQRQHPGDAREAWALLEDSQDVFTLHTTMVDPSVVHAIDTGAGTGGIASLKFENLAAPVRALITDKGFYAETVPSPVRV